MTQYDPKRIKEINEVLKAKRHDSVIYSSRLAEDCKYLLEVVEEQRNELKALIEIAKLKSYRCGCFVCRQ